MAKLSYSEVQQVKQVFRYAFEGYDLTTRVTQEVVCHTSEPVCPPEVDPFRASLCAFVVAAPDKVALMWFRQNTEGHVDFREMEKTSGCHYTYIWNRVDDMLRERARALPWGMAQQAITVFYEMNKVEAKR